MGREPEGSILTSPKGPTKMALSLLLYLFNERSLNAHCVPATQDIAVSYTDTVPAIMALSIEALLGIYGGGESYLCHQEPIVGLLGLSQHASSSTRGQSAV